MEIVSTLKDYPLIKRELNEVTELLRASNTQNAVLRTTITEMGKREAALELKNKITERQLRIREDELKAAGNSLGEKAVYATGGFTVGVLVILILQIL